MNNSYKILQLQDDASFEEVCEAYERLKEKYSKERYLSGEIGNNAARLLMQIEAAYEDIKYRNTRESCHNMYGSDLGDIEQLIRLGKYSDAQARLDSTTARTGEWHYLQSIIFYKREWLNEAKLQLTMAVSKEPLNSKFRAALTRLEMVMGNPNTRPETLGQPLHQGQHHGAGQPCGRTPTDTLFTCCNALCCAACCCSFCLF